MGACPNGSWLGVSRPHEQADADFTSIDQMCDAHGVGRRDLNKHVPFPKRLKYCDLRGAQPLIAASNAGRTAHEVEGPHVPRRPSGHGDRLSAWHLRR